MVTTRKTWFERTQTPRRLRRTLHYVFVVSLSLAATVVPGHAELPSGGYVTAYQTADKWLAPIDGTDGWTRPLPGVALDFKLERDQSLHLYGQMGASIDRNHSGKMRVLQSSSISCRPLSEDDTAAKPWGTPPSPAASSSTRNNDTLSSTDLQYTKGHWRFTPAVHYPSAPTFDTYRCRLWGRSRDVSGEGAPVDFLRTYANKSFLRAWVPANQPGTSETWRNLNIPSGAKDRDDLHLWPSDGKKIVLDKDWTAPSTRNVVVVGLQVTACGEGDGPPGEVHGDCEGDATASVGGDGYVDIETSLTVRQLPLVSGATCGSWVHNPVFQSENAPRVPYNTHHYKINLLVEVELSLSGLCSTTLSIEPRVLVLYASYGHYLSVTSASFAFARSSTE